MEVRLATGQRLAEFRILDAGRQDIVQRHARNDVPIGFIALVATLATRVGEICKVTRLASRDTVAKVTLRVCR